MSLSIQAPITAAPIFPRFTGWIATAIARRKARHIEAEAVRQLRKLDPHLLHDLDLDGQALWRPRPEIRQLQSAHLAAAFASDGDRNLLV